MIIDMICDFCWNKEKEDWKYWWHSLYDYAQELGRPQYVMDARQGVRFRNWLLFKRGMIQYMDEYGYAGSPVYKKFKRMSGRQIGEKFDV